MSESTAAPKSCLKCGAELTADSYMCFPCRRNYWRAWKQAPTGPPPAPRYCRRCGAELTVGVNIAQGRLDDHDYICHSCKATDARARNRRRRGWVDGKPPPRPPFMKAGDRHGRWTVLEDTQPGKDAKARCRCDCGTERQVQARNIRYGQSRSCGCLATGLPAEQARQRQPITTPAPSNHPLYNTWRHMVRRCTNPADKAWHHYGGRGITVCERWADRSEGFASFIADMGPKPSPAHSLERVDNDGGYEPANCVWATRAEQCANQRRAIGSATYAALLAENHRLREQIAAMAEGAH